ncbi:MAG: KpsF/GutQ family sugar-phosphate isomerase [Ferruginibacter sp.]
MTKATHDLIIKSAQRTIELQAAAVAGLSAFPSAPLVKAVEFIAAGTGRLVVSGIGKSAIVAQKIVATMNSTGTPSIFMHAADAIHGDLGMIQPADIVLVVSKSGDSPEIKVLAPLVKGFGNTLIAMVGNMSSYLSAQSDIVLNTTVEQEACPNNLAPTTSTTAQMVMGDVLAICLMEAKGFNADDFAKYHPGGTLGRILYLRAGDMITADDKPAVLTTDSIKTAIMEITKRRLGAAVVLSENKIAGIITDGDLRRMMESHDHFNDLTAKDVMSLSPKTAESDILAIAALDIMRKNDISQLIITEKGEYKGILHLHDLVREGII